MAQRFEIAHRHRWRTMAADDNGLELWLDGCLGKRREPRPARAVGYTAPARHCTCSSRVPGQRWTSLPCWFGRTARNR